MSYDILSLFYHYPLSRKSWKIWWKFFILLIQFPWHANWLLCLLLAHFLLIIVQLVSKLSSLYFHTAEFSTFIIMFWVEYAHIWEMIIYIYIYIHIYGNDRNPVSMTCKLTPLPCSCSLPFDHCLTGK